MRILDVRPAGYRVLIEMDLDQVEKVLLALSETTQLRYNGNERGKKEAVEYLVTEFYPTLERLVKDMKHGA